LIPNFREFASKSQVEEASGSLTSIEAYRRTYTYSREICKESDLNNYQRKIPILKGLW
jgi:hypothetical protein